MPRTDPGELAAIFAGGVAGALARWRLTVALPAAPGHWPWATFCANVVGALALGWLATRLQERLPLYAELVRRLRATGARGATALRGIWGYHGDHVPHGDRLLALRRHVPVVTVIVDEPAAIGRWFGIVDELTRETGLVTGELVPAR